MPAMVDAATPSVADPITHSSRADETDTRRVCARCGENFPSRDRLFRHLKAFPSHAMEVSGSTIRSGSDPRREGELAFDRYYTLQRVASPDEWRSAFERFKTPLPVSFRANKSSPHHDLAVRRMHRCCQLETIGDDRLCWKIPVGSEMDVGSDADHPGGCDVQPKALLIAAQNLGAVQRQEEVSLLPAMLLAPSAHHAVLDMCCAPGSKTLQDSRARARARAPFRAPFRPPFRPPALSHARARTHAS